MGHLIRGRLVGFNTAGVVAGTGMTRDRTRRRSEDPDGVEAAFEPIRADRVHGARALASEALRALTDLLDHWADRPDGWLRPAFRHVARTLEHAQPAMGPFLRWADEWRRLSTGNGHGGRVAKARAWVRRERARWRAEAPRVVRTSRRRFPGAARHVVTLSRSQTVLLALSALPRTRRPLRVSVLESLPGGEGRRFANDLRQAGLRARVIPDRAGPATARTSDLVILGADAVFSDGSVAHKIGTRVLAGAASRAGVPVIVVAGSSKFTRRPAPRRPLPPSFDRTPSRYITEFWTDRGVRPGGRRREKGPGRSPHPRL